MNYLLQIESLTKSFSRKIKNLEGIDDSEDYTILNDFNLHVPEAKIMALIGGNGAGKTTLFNIISGFLKPEKGSIIYKNEHSSHNLLKHSPQKIARLGIGRMFQDNHIFQGMSVLDNMLIAENKHFTDEAYSSILFSKKAKLKEEERIEKVKLIFKDLLDTDNTLWEKQSQIAGNLSHGQRRILGLARLFMQDYKLLLLDEPTSGVNIAVIEQIKNIIRRFVADGKTVLLIEHNLKVVKELADICCYMDKGGITYQGTPAEVIDNEEVKKTYLGI
jgi:ABC-type branched-subunit amino acid transport system ATPase component